MTNSNVFVDYRIKPDIPFFDKKRELINNQKVSPRKTITAKKHHRPLTAKKTTVNRTRSVSYNLLLKHKSTFLLMIASLIISLSLFPLYININSYFWEKKRVLLRENDIVYNLFLMEGIESRATETAMGGNVSYTLPSLKYGTYTVKKGDSLFGISHKFNLSVDTIITANNVKNARYLKIGTQLKIPNMSGIYYTVKKGDNLSSISRRYGVGVNNIVDLNDLSSSVIHVGQELFVPGGALNEWERAVAIGNVFMWPVKGRLTSNMGFRIDPFTKRRAYHAGIDIANRIGTKVTAAQYGKVIFSGYRGNYGKTVIIRHPDGYKTLYAHLYKINVKRGQAVKQGEVIGSIGSSGRSTGPHLHFEVHQNGKVLDPRKVLSRK